MCGPVQALLEPLEARIALSVLTISQENALLGTPQSQWDISGAGDASIQGFATDISVNQGQTVSFKINDTAVAPYHIDIYRMGWYQGNGARLVTSIASGQTLDVNQPAPLSDATTGLVNCGNWSVTASWAVPADATSGIYFAKVIRDNTGGASHIVFIIRNDAGHSDILFQTSDETWQAYNNWGGKALYDYLSTNNQPATQVSYNRPFNTRSGSTAEDWVFSTEYPMVRWLERNGYDVSYFTGVDAARYGSLIQNHKIYMSVGHDEYWSGQQRANVQAAHDAGVNLAFFSGNEIFWKTRWQNSIDGSNTSYRTLVCYKETHANAVTDPTDPPTWTGSWEDPRFSPPADGGQPQNALSGTLFTVNRGISDVGSAMTVPAAYANLRFWRNTSIASLTGNQVATLGTNVLGYEWDEDVANGFRPAGLFDMSATTQNVTQKFVDFGNTVAPGTATHSLTLYRASSGALVFGAGTVQWSWGLDGAHDVNVSAPVVDMQQATVNLLADMQAQPATLQSGLVAATASTDTIAPMSSLTAPAAGALAQIGQAVTIAGTAADTGGGVVAGVEVSTDGGVTWEPAQGTSSWSYKWVPGSGGSTTILSRAVDDSGNLQTPSAGVSVNVAGPRGITIWSDSVLPTDTSTSDTRAVEVGVKFKSDVSGLVDGIRFYKGSQNTGVHTGELWSSTGQLLATATFSAESASGWQKVLFSAPVAINANTVYVASYHTNTGYYASDLNYFDGLGVNNGPLHALSNSVGGGNGVFVYSAGTAFPTSIFQSTNYYVDVLFTPTVTVVNGAAAVNLALLRNGTLVNVFAGGAYVYSIDPQYPSQVAVNLGAGNDSLTLDFSGGSPMPAAGLAVTGSAGVNSLIITGTGASDSVTLGPNQAVFGTVPVSFSSIEAVQLGVGDILIGSLTLGANARAQLPQGAGTVLRTSSLSIDNTATLDLANGGLIVDCADAPTAAGVLATLSAKIALRATMPPARGRAPG